MKDQIKKIVESIMQGNSYPDGDPDGETHPQVSWLVGRLHVGTPNHEVIAHVDRKLKGGLAALTPDQQKQVVDWALNAHAKNQRDYREVMSGNLYRKRKGSQPDQIYGDKRDIMDEVEYTNDILDLHEILGQATADRDARHQDTVDIHQKYGKNAVSHLVSEKSKIVGLRSTATPQGKERVYYGQYGNDRNNRFAVKVDANKATHFENIAKDISGTHRHISSSGIVDIARQVASAHGGYLMDIQRAKGGLRARVPFTPPDLTSKGQLMDKIPLSARLAASRAMNTAKAAIKP